MRFTPTGQENIDARPMTPPTRPILAWALYDVANSAFATTVMAGFFPIFFREFWSAGAGDNSTFWLGVTNSIASLLVALSAPLLGALADLAGWRKKMLLAFALAGCLGTAGLSVVPAGAWPWASALYALAVLGFLGGNVFYDALLVDVASPAQRSAVSSLGFGLGYLGGGVLFAINVAMTLWPEAFGLASKAAAIQISFLTVAAWWAVFAMPLQRWVTESATRQRHVHTRQLAGIALRNVWHTLRAAREMRNVWLFLLAYWCYIDAIDTIIVMAVDYGLRLGLASTDLIAALLLTQFVGFPAALGFGWLSTRVGVKPMLVGALLIYAGVIIGAYFMTAPRDFYILAAVIGLVQGGVQALSRALYSCLIPADRAAEFFGFYNVLGKFAALLGPLLVGLVSALVDNPRWSVLSLLPLLIIGIALLTRVHTASNAASTNTVNHQ